MRELKRFIEPARPCSYLPDRAATLEYRVMVDVRPEELDAMLVRGWRRFGPVYFRHHCGACVACESLRIPVARFVPTQSQRRARRRVGRFGITFGAPQLDGARLALYRLWHGERERRRDWEASPLDEEGYQQQFTFPHPCAREVAMWDGERLVGLGICDVTPRGLSAVYFFYHPEIARLSPGVANVLLCIELAHMHGVPYVYLGYRVEACRSLRYKADYRPHEVLLGRPGEDEEPRWVEVP